MKKMIIATLMVSVLANSAFAFDCQTLEIHKSKVVLQNAKVTEALIEMKKLEKQLAQAKSTRNTIYAWAIPTAVVAAVLTAYGLKCTFSNVSQYGYFNSLVAENSQWGRYADAAKGRAIIGSVLSTGVGIGGYFAGREIYFTTEDYNKIQALVDVKQDLLFEKGVNLTKDTKDLEAMIARCKE